METDILQKINGLIGVGESYKAPERIMEIISDKTLADGVFKAFSKAFGYEMGRDWFFDYFEAEHADRKNRKQDFTPVSVSKLSVKLLGNEPQYGMIYEPAAGTGGLVIEHWYSEVKKHHFPWLYKPDNYLYVCEELSDRAVPFLLFNLMVRGMNALVVHGDALTREAKEVYRCDNRENDCMCFSELRKLPHVKEVEELCNVKFET